MSKLALDKESMSFRMLMIELLKTHQCYDTGIISEKFNIPSNLSLNIDNYGHFIDTFVELGNKLYLYVEKGYSNYKMFHKYILPTSVFLHYLNVDISKIPELCIYVVNNKTYEAYRENVGGEYSDQLKSFQFKQIHLILIKDYNDVREFSNDLSLNSLFHELTHLSDNIDFNGLNDVNNISYEARCHEIKARYISDLFLCVYTGLKSDYKKYHRNLINMMYVDMQRETLDALESTIEHISKCNNEMIYLENNSIHRQSHLIREYSLDNISYYKSLKCINKINVFFNRIEQIKDK